jgi:hypothetical protein
MKQTAVEWLESQIRYYISNDDRLFDMFKQAKEMEKQQIIDAHGIKTKSINQDQSEIITGRQYYNQTFKQQAQ